MVANEHPEEEMDEENLNSEEEDSPEKEDADLDEQDDSEEFDDESEDYDEEDLKEIEQDLDEADLDDDYEDEDEEDFDDEEEEGDEESDEESSDEDADPSKKGKRRRRKRQPKIDINKSPKLKRLMQDITRMDDAKELKKLRDEHNDRTRELINHLKRVQMEISNIRNQATEYRNKRNQLNQDVQSIKEKKNSIREQLNGSRTALKQAKRKVREDSAEGQDQRSNSQNIRKMRRKIDQLEKKIETEDLALADENAIVDEIDDLERKLQSLLSENRKPSQFKEEVDKIRDFKNELREINQTLRTEAEESQNYHLLYLDITKEIDELRSEKRSMQRELNENRFIADAFHNQLIGVSQKMNRKKMIQRRSQYRNKKKVKREIRAITLEEAKDKLKKGAKLNIFEARAFYEEKANNQD